MNKDKKLDLSFGAISKPIDKQLDEQGFIYNPRTIQRYQGHARNLLYIFADGILTKSQLQQCEKKIINKIAVHLLAMD